MQIAIRKANEDDMERILLLYKEVAAIPGGIARSLAEISEKYIDCFLNESACSGIHLVAEDLIDPEILVAEIHCSKLEPHIFEHVF